MCRGGMWLQDQRAGTVLIVTHQGQIGIRGIASGSKEERELGWFGWSMLRGISDNGRTILFEEEGDAGGPNYTVFLRDTDGSPPMRIGEGGAIAISPDLKWVITQPTKAGPMMVVPIGAGGSRRLSHDSVSYSEVSWMPDGEHILASGIDSGHGQRDYLIDFNTGDSKPITPEGRAGIHVSRDGRDVAVQASDGAWEILPLGGGAVGVIPGVNSAYDVIGWFPDGKSLYAVSKGRLDPVAKVYKVDPITGKMDFWRTFGILAGSGADSVTPPLFSSDGSAYAYVYQRLVSEAYLVTGLR
jgi:eukaryotic-like serine/threonine-protein kinase